MSAFGSKADIQLSERECPLSADGGSFGIGFDNCRRQSSGACLIETMPPVRCHGDSRLAPTSRDRFNLRRQERFACNRSACSLVLLLGRGGQVFLVRVDHETASSFANSVLLALRLIEMAGTRASRRNFARRQISPPLRLIISLGLKFSGHNIGGRMKADFRIAYAKATPQEA